MEENVSILIEAEKRCIDCPEVRCLCRRESGHVTAIEWMSESDAGRKLNEL